MSTKKQSVMDRAMLAVVGDKPQPAAGRAEGAKTAPGAFLGFMEKELDETAKLRLHFQVHQ